MLITTRNGQWIFIQLETSFLNFVAISNLYFFSYHAYQCFNVESSIHIVFFHKIIEIIYQKAIGFEAWIQWQKGIHDCVSSMNNAYGMKPCLVTFEPTWRVLILKASLTWNCNLLSMSKSSFLNVFYFWRGLYLLELIHVLR